MKDSALNLTAGADLDIGDESNRSPLNIAATYGNATVVQVLIEAGTF